MEVSNITMCLLILIISINEILSINSSAIAARDKRSSCTPKVRIKGCKMKPLINKIYTYYHYYQGAEVIPGCPNNQIEKITWSLYYIDDGTYINLEKFNNKLTVSIPPKLYDAGDYRLEIKVKEAGGNVGTHSCTLRFITEPPIINFRYGYRRRVNFEHTYQIDLTPSISYDKKHPLQLETSTKCELHKKSECDYLKPCKLAPLDGTNGMKFSLKFHECHQFHYVLAYTKHDGFRIERQQMIFPGNSKNAYVWTEIICEKNCDTTGSAFTNPLLPTIVQMKCFENCTALKINRWIVGDKSQKHKITAADYEILENNRIKVLENVFRSGSAYFVECNINGGLNSLEIQIPGKLIADCDIQPRSGTSLQTVFKINCNTTGHLARFAPFYQVYQNAETGTMLASSAFNEFEVIIAAVKNKQTQKLIISGHDFMFNKFKVNLPEITVNEIGLNEDVLNTYLNKINRLYNEGNGDLAGKYAQCLLLEMNNNDISGPSTNNAYSRLISSMNKMDVDSSYAYKQMSTLLPYFYKNAHIDLEGKKQLSKLCQKLSNVQQSNILKSEYKEAADAEIKLFASYTTKCGDFVIEHTIENEEIHLTTPDYFIKDPAIEEYYDNYEYVYTNLEEHKMKVNAMNSIITSTMSVASTLVAGEIFDVNEKNFDAKIVMNEGNLWTGKELIVNDTTIKVLNSLNKKYNKKVVAATITNFQRNFFESPTYKIDSNMVDVNFFVTDNGVQTKVPMEFEITLDITMDVQSKTYTLSVIDEEDVWTEHITINVHRFFTTSKRQYMCIIKTLEPTDKIQAVVVTGRRPNFDDFKGNGVIIIDGNESKEHAINYNPDGDEDLIAYIGIITHPDMLSISKTGTVDYHITLIEKACLIYEPALRDWMPGPCKANLIYVDNLPKLKCTCIHNSLFGANVNGIETKLETVEDIIFETKNFKNYTILIFVSVLFAGYCIALCFFKIRYTVKGGKDRIFFLSDNLKNDRYGYLVIVKTGSINNAGTTSNISFKLQGDKFTCKPHVLNYPDPQKRLLQIGTTDCYILSTEQYMGTIEAIHLWFDSIGLRPSWYCERITVIDLQTRDYYYFIVEKWLSVLYSKRIQMKVLANKNVYDATSDVVNHVRKCVRIYAGAFHTWNIINKAHDHLFAYNERLTVVLSIIYTTCVLNVLFLYIPDMKMSDIYGHGRVVFHINMLLYAVGSSFLACLLNYPFIFFFRNSDKDTKNIVIISTPTLYTTKCNLITWGIITIYLFICVSYLVIFGFWVSFNTTMVWIINTTVSLIMGILIVENLYIIGMRMILLKLKQMHVEIANISVILKQAEEQRKILFRKFGEVLMRPYFRKHYRILRSDNVAFAQSKEIARVDTGELFKEMCVFIIFILILYFILLADSDYMNYYSNMQMRRMIADEWDEDSLDTIYSIDDIYDYINDTLLNAVHTAQWYDRYNSLDGGIMADFKTKILGVVQLRQQRRSQLCQVPYELAKLDIPCSNRAPIFDNWTYIDGSKISQAYGQIKLYSGEGYTSLMGRTLYNSYYLMNYLKDIDWIDINTEVLIIEFWTYNTDYNIFNAVRVLIERSNTGLIITSMSVITERYIQSNYTMELIIIAAIIILIIIVMVLLLKRIVTIIRNKMGHFKSFWNILDFLILCLSAAIIILFFAKKNVLHNIVNQLLESDRNEFIYYFSLTTISTLNTTFSSILLCFATIKLWKYLRFGTVFQELEYTIKLFAIPMLPAIFYHFCAMMAFGFYFHLILESKVIRFSSMTKTLLEVLSFFVDVERVKNYLVFINPFSTLMFLIYDLVTLTFVTLYVTIIMIAYEESKNYYSNRQEPYNIKHYFVDETLYLTELSKTHYTRLRGGGDDNQMDTLIYPKDDIQLYADSMSTTESALKLMQMLTLGVIRNLKVEQENRDTLTNDDFSLLARIVIRLYKEKNDIMEKKWFIVGEDPTTNKIKFVEHSKMLEMEIVTRQLLHGFQEEEENEDKQMILHIGYDKRLDKFQETISAIENIIGHIRIV